jgi:predicted nucleic-acid-binding Zn-ribbon protein
MVQEQFRAAYENIEAKLIDSLANHVRTSQQQHEENKEAIAVVSARADNIEQDIERHQFEIETLHDDIETHSGHINRIDEAIGNLTHARVQPINTPDIQALIARIAVLEESVQRNQFTDEMIDRFKKQAQRDDDRYFMSTLSIKGFRPDVVGHNMRQSARDVLRIIGSEDLIGSVNKISFKSGNTRMRITFDHPNDLNTAIHKLAKSIKQIKDNGQTPGITFSTLTPPRFGRERDILHGMAEGMKRDGQISRYHYVMIRNQLCMKVSKPGQRDSILSVPVEAEDMDVSDQDQEQAGSRCPICLGPFDNITQINVYECGHTFHAACLRSSLSQSMKCPTCRSIPTQVQLDQIECTGCRNDILDPQSRSNQDHIVLSRRCGHLHLYDCQMSYLNTLEGNYPQTPEGFNDIRTAENIQGCSSCYLGNATNFQDNNFIHDVAFEAGMTDYVDLENVRNPAPAPNPTPQPDPAPAPIPIPQPPLSGANAIPIRAVTRPVPPTNQIDRPTTPPPPPPSHRVRNRRGNARN